MLWRKIKVGRKDEVGQENVTIFNRVVRESVIEKIIVKRRC